MSRMERFALRSFLFTLCMSLLWTPATGWAGEVPPDLVAGPTDDLAAMIVASGPAARKAGIDSYRIDRDGRGFRVRLQSGDLAVATLRKTCECSDSGFGLRLEIEAAGSLLELRSDAENQQWWFDGRPVETLSGANGPRFGSPHERSMTEAVAAGELSAFHVLQILAAEADLGLWTEGSGGSQGAGLLSCPACREVSSAHLATRAADSEDAFIQQLAITPGGFDCGKRGGWSCSFSWNVSTSERVMQGTRFECGGGLGIPGVLTISPGYCGDWSHSQPASWVDVAGGISQSCNDHSTSFYGPLAGEWNGCTSAYQQSTGVQIIESVNQGANYWPFPGNQNWSWDVPGCVSLLQPPPPPTVLITPGSYTVTPAFASIYDLDTCTFKQLAGTIYWDPFTVVAQRTVDQPFYKVTEVVGSAPTQCATQVEACENTLLCSDLIVRGVQLCTFDYDEPMTRCDTGCYF